MNISATTAELQSRAQDQASRAATHLGKLAHDLIDVAQDKASAANTAVREKLGHNPAVPVIGAHALKTYGPRGAKIAATVLRRHPVALGATVAVAALAGVVLLSRKAKAKQAAEGLTATQRERQEDLLDEGIEESFPASDPVSIKRVN